MIWMDAKKHKKIKHAPKKIMTDESFSQWVNMIDTAWDLYLFIYLFIYFLFFLNCASILDKKRKNKQTNRKTGLSVQRL